MTTIGQLAILEPAQPQYPPICVLNTHLFFHPNAPNIRAMQVAALLAEATHFMDRYACPSVLQPGSRRFMLSESQLCCTFAPSATHSYRADTGRSPTLLFGGDLNSRHNTAVVDLLKDVCITGRPWLRW